MRIGICGLGLGLGRTGGVQVYLRELLRALATYGDAADEYVLVLTEAEAEAADPSAVGAAGRRLRVAPLAGPSRPSPTRRRLTTLAKLVPGLPLPPDPLSVAMDSLGLDLIHFPCTRAYPLPRTTPFVLTFFDLQDKFLPSFFTWRERLAREADNRRALAMARSVLAPTRFTAACLTDAYREVAAKLTVVPVGVSQRFTPQPEPEEKERLALRYGLPAGGYLFYPANPWPHKNHERLFDAVRLVREHRGFALPVVCTGRLPGQPRSVTALAQAAGLPEGQVIDLGFVAEEDVPALYRSARLLAFPSLFEGFGMPLLEAMACGCPVASSRATCLPEVSGEAAHLFDPLSPAAMAAALAEVWEEGPLRRGLIERGLLRAESLRWARVVPDLLRAYRNAGSS